MMFRPVFLPVISDEGNVIYITITKINYLVIKGNTLTIRMSDANEITVHNVENVSAIKEIIAKVFT